MRTLSTIYALALADFLERTRRYQYVATIAVTVFAGTLLLPSKGANYSTFLIDGYRGIYNSAWIGVAFAALASLLLSLFGFYNVKSAVARDRETRVGEIVASTSIGKLSYAIGKVLSNFAVLLSMLGVFFVVAIVMQLVRGESYAIDAWAIAQPLLLIVAPVLAIVSAVAVLFEMIPWLRGGFGNVVYFFVWIGYLVGGTSPSAAKTPWWHDLMGIDAITRQVWQAVRVVDPKAKIDSIVIGDVDGGSKYFTFHGCTWTTEDVVGRLMWLVVALGITAAAALLFDRFTSGARAAQAREPGKLARALRAAAEKVTTPILDVVCTSDFGAIVVAELRLLVNGLSFWWYAVAAGFFVAGLFTRGDAQNVLIGLAWIWPILQLSQIGTREAVYDTEQFVYPTLHPIRRQFVAQWAAGVALALLCAGGSLVHFAATGNLLGIAGIVAGALFVPSLALACGAVSGTTRLFEILYLILWYMGPMNHTLLDYTQGANAAGFAVAAAILLAIAAAARRMRLALA